jgi:hypothetical protein
MKSLIEARFSRKPSGYPSIPRARADGVLAHENYPGFTLRYELKSVYLPHYYNTSAAAAHNPNYETLLRLEHRNGALEDVLRLRGACDTFRVFVLVAVSWHHCERDTLRRYEDHRDVVLGTFMSLAGLAEPTRRCSIRGPSKPWSADVRAWSLTGPAAATRRASARCRRPG